MLAPKVGCALKCAAWAGGPTPKKHPKASSGLWAMGPEMANPFAIAADDEFINNRVPTPYGTGTMEHVVPVPWDAWQWAPTVAHLIS